MNARQQSATQFTALVRILSCSSSNYLTLTRSVRLAGAKDSRTKQSIHIVRSAWAPQCANLQTNIHMSGLLHATGNKESAQYDSDTIQTLIITAMISTVFWTSQWIIESSLVFVKTKKLHYMLRLTASTWRPTKASTCKPRRKEKESVPWNLRMMTALTRQELKPWLLSSITSFKIIKTRFDKRHVKSTHDRYKQS